MNKSNDPNVCIQPQKTVVDFRVRVDRIFIIITIFWTLVIVTVFALNYRDAYSSAVAIAKAGLVESYNKDVVYRRWAAIHGGVYVPVTPDSPSSPYLEHIPERDISTPSGKKLTLINPAYMTRQAQELAEKQYGHKGHITSLNPLRPENKADEWETKALLAFERGEAQASSFELLGNETYLRFMRPFLIEQSCLRCHESQGYKLGEIRGGISVSTPWKPVEEALVSHIHYTIMTFSGIWLIGLFGMFGARNVIKRNISERERADEERLESERKLLHAQKLESLGTMAGGIAHDFNNLLMGVLGNLELALTDPDLVPATRRNIEKATQASERSAELSRQMLIYSGSGFHNPTDLDLAVLCHKSEDLLKSNIPKTTSLNFKIDKDHLAIRGDAEQIQRVITHLVINASEAIGAAEGEVTLRTGVMECDAAYLGRSRLEDKPEPGRFVFLEVTDTGCGMDDNTLHRLFEPFFTTKFWGRGLGMAEVIGIVKGHDGAIIVDSQVGMGTTIRVLFPAMAQVQAPSIQDIEVIETKAPASDSGRRRKTILLVDDEELVRELCVEWLELLGYDTIAAFDGVEGVRIFRERLNEIDIVMLDFVMPRMNGVEAFEELICIKPDVKVLFSSGYTEELMRQRFSGRQPESVLHKPYDMDILKAELDRLLGTAGSGIYEEVNS